MGVSTKAAKCNCVALFVPPKHRFIRNKFTNCSRLNMGGIFSGWHGKKNSRAILDETPRIRIHDHKQMLGAYYLALSCGGCSKLVGLTHTPGTLGGTVVWFACPQCTRRCAVLYFIGAEFCCRQCTRGRYASQVESAGKRAERKAKKIIRRTGLDPSRPDGKVKWRRWPTHKRLSRLADQAAEILCAADVKLYAYCNELSESSSSTSPMRFGT